LPNWGHPHTAEGQAADDDPTRSFSLSVAGSNEAIPVQTSVDESTRQFPTITLMFNSKGGDVFEAK
jgi:ATP-dependent protease ClpP protease subunit